MPTNEDESNIFAEWLQQRCNMVDDELVRGAETNVKGFLGLCSEIPSEYRWRFSGAEAQEQQWRDAAGDDKELQRLYWDDMLSDVEAYSTTSVWRGMELLNSSLMLLNGLDIVASAVLARSLFELSCSYLYQADEFKKNMSEISFPAGQLVISTSLRKKVNKMLWGSRLGEVGKAVPQTNVMTYIQKLGKNEGAGPLEENYEFLCDVAHPSFIGNARYWSTIEKTNEDGSEIRLLHRKSTDVSAMEIAFKVVWTISWSAIVMKNAFVLIQEGMDELRKKLPR